MQLQHVFCIRDQYIRHFSAWTGHFSTPPAFDAVCGSAVRSPCGIACDGQSSAHFLQDRQNSVTPKSIGLSATSGRFVSMGLNLSRGPSSGVTNRPLRARSPSPAFIASGTESTTSLLLHSIVSYPRPRMKLPRWFELTAIRL